MTKDDRIALLGSNQTCGTDAPGSLLGLRLDGRARSAGIKDFARWEPQIIAGPESLFDIVPGRRCEAAPEAGTCDSCDRLACLRACAEDPLCVAAQLPRAAAGCILHRACTATASLAAPEHDLYLRRGDADAEKTQVALRSNLAMLSFAPVEIAGGLGGTLKVCFCDSAQRPCGGVDSFKVEIGVVHVSGVACQASRPLAATHSCRHQMHDGLACLPVDPVAPNARYLAPTARTYPNEINETNQTNATNASA